MHRECGHADVDFVTVGTLLGQLAVQTPMGLLVPGQVGRGGVVFAALVARVSLT